ncbi:MAG: TIGR02302 family protein [Alphaproteobacteria bacterium]
MGSGSGSTEIRALARFMARRLWLARLCLAWESLWPALWPAVAIAGIFLVAALFNLWSRVPGSLHAAALLLFAIGFILALIQGLRGWRYPGEEAAVRRLETASGFTHRPLAALRDSPATGVHDNQGRALWRTHLQRIAQRAKAMRIGLPSPGMARHDPLGLRAALALVLIIAFTVGGSDSANRLARALQPDFSGASAATAASLTLWLTPPSYTAMAPLFLAAGTGDLAETRTVTEIVDVPSGAALLARVHGGTAVPQLEIGGEVIEFDAIDGSNYELSTTLLADPLTNQDESRRLTVRQGGEILGDWSLAVLVDQPPLIEFSSAPGRTARSALRLDYLADDDYGLVTIEAVVALIDDPSRSFTLPMTLPSEGITSAEDSNFYDLTAHPWAGLEVSIELAASDAPGQVGISEPVTMVLPERIFNHPVARRLIEERRRLALDPTQRNQVSNTLDDISRRPEHFFEDLNVFLGLRVARLRLLYDISDAIVGEVQDMLWDIALVIEDGPIALSEQALRDAERALSEALASNASDAEIDRLVDQMLEALDNYLNDLMEQAANRSGDEPSLEEQFLQAVDRDQIRDLIERIRELAKTGSREAARELLEQLKAALESMRANSMMGEDREGGGENRKILRELEKLIARQQQLLDKTFRRAQGNGEQPGPSGTGNSQNGPQGSSSRGSGGSESQPGLSLQQGLHAGLSELMRRWGGDGQPIPLSLNRASQAMRDALQALSAGLAGQAVGPQTSAIDEMQQGAQALLQAMMEEIGRAPQRPGGLTGGFGNALDPLGRGLLGRGFQDDSRTAIPDKADVQRSREILDELYRRAGEFQRPSIEREYIKRLLKRF